MSAKVSLQRLTVADGLNQSTVNVIFQDNRGFIWIGTDNGINIYDGYTLRELPGIGDAIKNFSVYQIRQGTDGLIWITTSSGGLFSYDVNTERYQQVLAHDPNNAEYAVNNSLEHEPYKSEWIITDKTVGIYSHESGKFSQVVNLSEQLKGYDSIFLAEKIDDFLFIATRIGTFVYQISTKTIQKISFLNNVHFNDVDFDLIEANRHFVYKRVGDRVFIGTNDGIFEFSWQAFKSAFSSDLKQLAIRQLVKNIAVWQLSLDGDNLVIGANSGLYELNLYNNKFGFLLKYSDTFDDIGQDSVVAFLQGQNGNYWMGSKSNGLFSWNPKSRLVKNVGISSKEGNLSHNVVTSLLPDSNKPHLLWIGTSNGLNLLDTQTNSVQHFLVSEQSKSVYTTGNIISIQQTTSYLWLSTYKGVVLFDKQLKKVLPLPFEEEINALIQQDSFIFLIEDNQLWLSGEKGSIRVDLDTGELENLISVDEKIGINNIWVISPTFPNRSNEVIYSTNDEVWAYDKESKSVKSLIKFPSKSDADSLFIDNYVVDKNNILWLAYSGVGLFGFDANTYEQRHFFNNTNSVIDNYVYGLMTDDVGNIWFSSHGGIFMLDVDNLHLRQFAVKDGFSSNEFNSGAYAKMHDGMMAYGSMQGLNIFDPIILHRSTAAQTFNIALSNISLLNRELKYPPLTNHLDTIELNFDDVGIRFDFTTLAYLESQPTKYLYKLSGPIAIETPPTIQNYVTFPALESGNYTLSVSAISPSTGEKSQPIEISIVVSYAPLQSPLAYSIYSLIALFFIALWIRGRHLKKMELVAAHEEVKSRENRLQLALSGSNSEVWDWFAAGNLTHAKRIIDELGVESQDQALGFQEYQTYIHPQDLEQFLAKWHRFIQSSDVEESFESTYRVRNNQGKWIWYRDLGKAVAHDPEGRPTRVTGSYTNITQRKAEEERAQHYGEAFQQTKDWVFIINEKFTKVTVNQSMRNLFGWDEEEFDFDPKFLGFDDEKIPYYMALLPSIKASGHWSGEEIVTTPSGEQYHVLLNISASKNKADNSYYYVFVMTDISAQKSAENELRVLANYDHLTGLPNRSLLLERIKHGIEQANRHGKKIALFFIDLDRFKQINDTLGHEAGDLLLKEVTQRLNSTVREDDTVARLGGDEFVVLLEHFKQDNDLLRVAQKVIDVLGQPLQLKNNVVSVGASVGISLYPSDSANHEELLRHADVAMYHAKQQGRNNFQFFTQHMNDEAKVRLKKESELKLAVSQQEFYSHYQPIVDALTGKAIGVELLMRWQCNDRNVPPSEFIPLAEDLGLINEMTNIVLSRALPMISYWRKIRPAFYLSINISAPQFADSSFIQFMTNILATYDIPANAIRLEVTESAFISEPEKAVKTMQSLSDLGFKIALDDFGTGYSSLSYLKQLPLDIIKIDRSFVSGIGQDSTDEAIVNSTLVLAKQLGIDCIAEGVETEAHLHYLTERSCHFIQGYFYYGPLSATDLTNKLLEDNEEITASNIRS